jgi:predicted component of type VI protein secretion system
MNIRKFVKLLWSREKPTPAAPNPAVVRQVRASLTMIAQTQDQELGCDEVYALLDLFAERVRRGEDAAALMPLVHHHLAMCPDCREEFEALLRSLEFVGL